jgi:hypothetical protein
MGVTTKNEKQDEKEKQSFSEMTNVLKSGDLPCGRPLVKKDLDILKNKLKND